MMFMDMHRKLGLTLSSLLLMMVQPVQAALFQPLPTGVWAKPLPSESSSSAFQREAPRLLKLNPDELWHPDARGERHRSPEILQVNGLNGAPLVLRRLTESREMDGRTLWQGRVVGDDNGSAWLALSANGISGHVRTGGDLIQIRNLGDGVHRLLRLDAEAMALDGDILRPPVDTRQRKAGAQPPGGALNPSPGFEDGNTVKVLMLYSSQVKQAHPDIEDLLTLEFAEANAALAAGELPFRLEKVKAVELDTSSLSGTAVSALLMHSGPFAGVPRLRAKYQADLVHYVGNPKQFVCGVAYLSIMPEPRAFPETAYGVTDPGCLGNLTMVHELGHNLGALHDRYVHDGGGSFYNYGYVDTEARFQTIMAYANLCGSLGIGCTRLARFSNPRQHHNGRALGIAEGLPGAADNAQMIGKSAPSVANYQGVAGPGNFTASRGSHADRVVLTWDAVPGANEYLLTRGNTYFNGYCAPGFETTEIRLTGTRYEDVGVTPGKTYCYTLAARKNDLYPGADQSHASELQVGHAGSRTDITASGLASRYTLSGNELKVDFSLNGAGAVNAFLVPISVNFVNNAEYDLTALGGGQFRLRLSVSQGDALGRAQFVIAAHDGTTGTTLPVLIESAADSNQAAVLSGPDSLAMSEGQTVGVDLVLNDSERPLWTSFVGGLLNLRAEDARILPRSGLSLSATDWSQGRFRLNVTPAPGAWGKTNLRLAYNDGEHLVVKNIAVDIARAVYREPLVQSVQLYWPTSGVLTRLLPAYDLDGDALSFSLLSPPAHGRLEFDTPAGSFTYRPNPGTQADSFRFAVREAGNDKVYEATVSLAPQSLRKPARAPKLVSAHSSALLALNGEVYTVSRGTVPRCGPGTTAADGLFHKLPIGSHWAQIGINSTTGEWRLLRRDGRLFTCADSELKPLGNDSDWQVLSENGYSVLKADGSLWSVYGDGRAEQANARYDWVDFSENLNVVALDRDNRWWSWGGWTPTLGRVLGVAPMGRVTLPADTRAVQMRAFRAATQDSEGWFWGWGDNAAKMFLDGQDAKYVEPTRFGDQPWDNLAIAGYHAAGIRGGSLWTWGGAGSASAAELGRGPNPARGPLAQVGSDTDWAYVYAGSGLSWTTFAIKEDGSIWAAGSDQENAGVLGLGSVKEAAYFTRVDSLPKGLLGFGDHDGDGLRDERDPDDDNDGVADADDEFRWDPAESVDTDWDGAGNNADTDDDNDGMPDAWESAHGLDPLRADADGDADGDGASNLDEYLEGSDPQDRASLPSTGILQAPFITGLANSNPTEVMIVNTGASAVPVVATLYHESGAVLGAPRVRLAEALAPRASLVYDTRSLELAFGAASWGQRARLVIHGGKSVLRVVDRVRGASGVLANMSCTAYNRLPFLPSPDNRYKAVVRITNVSASPKTVRGTLRNEDGQILGTPDSLIVENLAPQATAVFETGVFAGRFGLSSWRQKAWLALSEESQDIVLMAVIRSEDSSFDNLSCTHTQFALNLPGEDLAEQSVLRMLWAKPNGSPAHGRLYDSEGQLLGGAALLSAVKPMGVVFQTRAMLQEKFGAPAWRGHAQLVLDADAPGGEILQITRNPNGILSETGCSTPGAAYALPFSSPDSISIRWTNLGSTSKDVRGAFHGMDGSARSAAGGLLLGALPPMGSRELTLEELKRQTGADWLGLANLIMDAGDDVRVSVFSRSPGGVLTNIGCPAR